MATSPKPFALVLMPFSKAFEDAYELAIRPACESAGAYAERVDQQAFAGSIIERVCNQISKAGSGFLSCRPQRVRPRLAG